MSLAEDKNKSLAVGEILALLSQYNVHSLSNIVKETQILTDANARRNSTKVEGECKSECQVFCDEIELKQVFVNMINNTIDAVKSLSEKWVTLQATIELMADDPHTFFEIRFPKAEVKKNVA